MEKILFASTKRETAWRKFYLEYMQRGISDRVEVEFNLINL